MGALQQTECKLRTLLRRYDPENDYSASAPPVTWAEYRLAEAILALAEEVERLTPDTENEVRP